jgi:hypothetical protein
MSSGVNGSHNCNVLRRVARNRAASSVSALHSPVALTAHSPALIEVYSQPDHFFLFCPTTREWLILGNASRPFGGLIMRCPFAGERWDLLVAPFLLEGGNMCRSNKHRRLLALGVVVAQFLSIPAFANRVLAVPTAFSETPDHSVPQTAAQSAAQPPVQSSAPTPVPPPIQAPTQAPAIAGQSQSRTQSAAASPLPPATPEEVGDALMAQQHYQAAIEAYRRYLL